MGEHENGFCVSPFLGDGFDLEYTIPAQEGRWPAVRIKYRPLSKGEESLIFARKNLSPSEPMARFYAEAFAGNVKTGTPAKLVGWDLKDRESKPVSITADNLCKLTPQFFDVLQSVIDGTVVPMEQEVKNS